MAATFDTLYPHSAWWAEYGGWIELGRADYSDSLIRVLDEGGMLWEGRAIYPSVAAALNDAERFINQWRLENGYA